MNGFRRAIGVLAALAVMAIWPALAGSLAGSAASSALTFGNPTISGIQGTGFEQGLRLDGSGRVYTSAPGALSSTISYINRSFDAGQTFKWVAGAEQPFGKPITCVGGGDSELATDSGNNLYFADLTLLNMSTARSGDQGRTFAFSCAGVPATPVDRPWLAAEGNATSGGSVTMAYDLVPNVVGLPDPTCQMSNRLVLDRSPVVDASLAGVQYGPVQIINQPCNEGIMGNVEIFTANGVKRAFVGHDNQNLDSILMGRCDLVPFTASPSGYANCQDVVVSHFPGFITGANFPTTAIDRAGNLFIVWEQAPFNSTTGLVTGDTLLFYAVSTDQGNTWTPPRQLPTPGLHNNVFAWPAAGDAGRVDIAWYGTKAIAPNPSHGPDSVSGDWSLFLAQSLNFTSSTPTWTTPIPASEHFVHRGSMFTLIGGQNGDRTLGDFLQMRIGSQGEANISYADSNSIDEFASQAAYVRQNGGPSLFASVGTVSLPPERFNSVQVGPHAATFDSAGVSSSNQPNLEVLGSQMSMPNSNTLQIKMLVADLTSLAPKPDAGGTTLVWHTQWKVPSSTDLNGGKYFHAYMQSIGGAPPTFAVGENAVEQQGGGLLATYPGQNRYPNAVTSPAVTGSFTPTAPGVITINVPVTDVTEAGAINKILYSVTSSSMTLTGTADGPNAFGVGGVPFNLVDVAPAYDFNPALATPPFQICHEGDGGGTFQGLGGTATFQFDEDACEDSDSETISETDPGAANFRSTQITSVAFDDLANTVTIIGNGTDNGKAVTFTMVGAGTGLGLTGSFSLALSDGYVASGPLLSGSIQLR
jgi:hypothetical protein